MYKIVGPNEKTLYELAELAKMFLPSDEILTEIDTSLQGDKNSLKRNLYNELSNLESKTLDWGILTGVRPTKLFNELVRHNGFAKAKDILSKEYYLSPSKIDLLSDTYDTQIKTIENSDKDAIGLYIGIPFCPSRCLYCSFTSNKINKPAASAYLKALTKEIIAVKELIDSRGLHPDSIYIGGGTPTSLDEQDFDYLMSLVKDNLLFDSVKEFTVECGRPDTITETKLKSLLKANVGRISINPQTFKDETLVRIGRNHTSADIINAYKLARSVGTWNINMDLITGLPDETAKDFDRTLDITYDLNPENITVHTLAVKKASRLIDEDKNFAFKQADIVRQMLEISSDRMNQNGYKPYYLYRQKHMAGNFENVGYSKLGTGSLYNIRIMEENQTIIAMGAGSISKVYYPLENRLERIPNVSNYEIYIERIDEMINRKENGL